MGPYLVSCDEVKDANNLHICSRVNGEVGMGMNPPQYLCSGDRVEMGIDGVEEMAQRIVGSSS